jgi:hypothetical protein
MFIFVTLQGLNNTPGMCSLGVDKVSETLWAACDRVHDTLHPSDPRSPKLPRTLL